MCLLWGTNLVIISQKALAIRHRYRRENLKSYKRVPSLHPYTTATAYVPSNTIPIFLRKPTDAEIRRRSRLLCNHTVHCFADKASEAEALCRIV
jgi:hypothetical protein